MITTNKKGFSLIELSIVLIIIGLLVAGITGGSSLIKSAELRAVMSDIRNYQTAVNAYYTSRGELPGANGSSEMEFSNSCEAWADMVNEGIVDDYLSSFGSKDSTTNKYSCSSMETVSSANSVSSKMKGGYYALGYNDEMLANVIFLVGNGQETSKMGTAITGSASSLGTTVVSRKDAKFLDDKMDNGISDSGKIFGFTGSNSGTASGGCVYNNSDAISNETTRDCGVAMSIGL